MDWLVWTGSAAALLLVGFIPVWAHRQRVRHRSLELAVSRAREAIVIAEASQNACAARDPRADALLAEARGLLSGVAEEATARRAERLAREADTVWRRRRSDTDA